MLHRERDHYEENMKKAFMRGVCALNMEAMNMFHEPEPGTADPDSAAVAQTYSMYNKIAIDSYSSMKVL